MRSKVSVIIPIYNAERYLRKCLDSVVSQTYKELQIILVDDGSSDASGDICDEYSLKDPRIQVIHKANGGVSSARNAGLEVAVGEWIGFVDSDDWIEQDMFEYLLENAERCSAEIATCALWEEVRDERIIRGANQVLILTRVEAMEGLLKDDQINNYLWNKLWRKDLFCEIRFPEGRTFEDVAVVYQLFERASKVICLSEPKYHYLQHKDSILDNQSLRNKTDFYFATKLRMNDLETRWEQYLEILQASCVAAAIGIWAAYCFNSREERQKYESLFQEIAEFSKKRRSLVYKHMNIGRTGKWIVMLTAYPRKWAFLLAGILGEIYRRKHGRSI